MATNPVSMKYSKRLGKDFKDVTHIYANGAVCETDSLGHSDPQTGLSPTELVVHARDGFIPLWAKEVVLKWRFNERSMTIFRNPDQARDYLRNILAEGILLWEDAAPVKFKEVGPGDAWDFELVVSPHKKCVPNVGCTLASAFLPDGGRHELTLYPDLFDVSPKEQAETMAHEIGHVFGLRHFFAQIEEQTWASEVFGEHNEHKPFSIMNYGKDSFMTATDRDDLKKLYNLVWSGALTEINGTPIRLVHPFTTLRPLYGHEDLIAMRM
ncbi:matrix metalloproteinase-11 [Hoeflea sp. WL0058]|uniref:Matrix metalloproteinase-11 n=1 Tax=Flavimaribacter sediminis TaxID=2865987 RepID=A0AAE2ZVB5_9HYPH|nr:matrix metalloproteinase-11 [Flavimaribacter sediminis]MBW8640367.1 matrix metalloproteinase-11 [Flavimaribacter sediminis]